MPGSGKRIAILQSNYIPWKGYFDQIAAVDEFILYDDAQYTKHDWRNRNRIKTPDGLAWLTIPVEASGKLGQRVRDAVVRNQTWSRTHWRTLQQRYARAPHFGSFSDRAERWYTDAGVMTHLSAINEHFLREICVVLGIDTPITQSSNYDLVPGRSERLLELCRQSGARRYLSGPAAREYLDVAMFADAGISVEWMSYEGYPEYPQLHPPFDHGVSVLDLLFNTGAEAPRYMKMSSSPA